jgi:hypothetical protein
MKFPAGTVAGHYKNAVAHQPEQDAVRFDNQKLNWSLKEFDVSAIEYHHFRGTVQHLHLVLWRLVTLKATS